MEEVIIYDIDEVIISDMSINLRGSGSVGVTLQYGSDADMKRDYGVRET